MQKNPLILSAAVALLLALNLNALAQAPAAPATEPAKPASGAPKPEDDKAGDRRGQRNPEARLKHLKETLALTDEQAAKIQVIMAQQRDKMKDLKDEKDETARKEKRKEIMQAGNAEIQAVLTPEQQEKWKAEMAKRKEERKNK